MFKLQGQFLLARVVPHKEWRQIFGPAARRLHEEGMQPL